ncbi:hypothetical protein JOQ06_024107 [Pogonophryne albipinna]|uniref:DUF4371 domain-containing protein n=1 Tax=Pogonophryne albipinna TaxID=1090488 RepID=A0AAD6BQJ4_9TELE|nr:hypothetical protein JOQ06_024107 [Pogonophryne albipinna]
MDIRKWLSNKKAGSSGSSKDIVEAELPERDLVQSELTPPAREDVPAAARASCSTISTRMGQQPPPAPPFNETAPDDLGTEGPAQQPLRGTLDAVESREDVESGLFLSMMEYTLRKDPALAKAFSTIPKNATYTSHDIQNEIIGLMSEIVTSEIVEEIGDSWYTLKLDGTKDPTGCENVSIVVRYLNKNNDIRERLLVMATTKHCDALSLTDLVISELRKAGLTTDKILSQCYDGASVMSGKRGGIQKEKVEREVPYVHCFNHQLHLVVIHAMSSENTLQVFIDVCDMLYRFLKKPTVSAVYTGQRLKRLLDQRWTGHLGTVSVIVNSYDAVEQFLAEIDSSGLPTQLRVEAAGLLKAVQEPHFKFTAVMVHKILALLDPPNKVLQDKKTDLYTGVKVVKSALDCVEHLRSDSEFQAIWEQCSTGSSADASEPAAHPPMKRVCQVPTHLNQYVVESTIDWKERLFRKFNKQTRRLQLY